MRTTTQKAAMVFAWCSCSWGCWGSSSRRHGMESHPENAPKLLGLFPVNLLHNLVHPAFGAWGLAASRSHSASRGYHRAGVLIYLVLVVLAFIDPTTFGLVPIGGNDPWLHLVLAAGLLYFGFVHREAGVPANS